MEYCIFEEGLNVAVKTYLNKIEGSFNAPFFYLV